ncbi:carbohydrate ABC transporter permease [Clostridium botulinum]|uniref:carbohydrate ABC transporter permease n=1 Tax=Clostridium botulinum TaxID=1491 RepID=UPI003A80CF37
MISANKHKKSLIKIFVNLLIIIGAIAMILPFLWMISTSFKDPVDVFKLPIQWIPKKLNFNNYVRLFTEYGFQKYIFNSVFLSTINIIGNVISCSLVAYGFACQRFKYRKQLFMLVLATMMLPGEVIFFPQFILFNYIGWFGTMKPLWVPSFLGNAFYIFLLRQYFLTIPTELLDSARIDGCSELRIFSRIVMPMSKPAIMVVIMYTFMGTWNDFFGPLIYAVNEEQRTVAVALNYLKNTYEGTSSIPITMAASVLLIIPSLLIYYFGQRYFVQGTVFKGVDK